MEDVVMRRSGHGGGVIKEERRVDSGGDEGGYYYKEEVAVKVGSKRPYHDNDDLKLSTPDHRDFSLTKQVAVASTMEPADSKASSLTQKEQDDQLESARAEMSEVREENQRLKKNLDEIMTDYRNLQMQFHEIIRQEEPKEPTETADNHQAIVEPAKLLSLCLGRVSSTEPKKDGKIIRKTSSQGQEDDDKAQEGLSLGLECKLEVTKSADLAHESWPNPSPVNSFEDPIEEAGDTNLQHSKALKTMQNGDGEVLQQNQVKRARVSVRARCDTPTMDDGCQWRKYGQKIAKGNPCPRAYYKCTVAPSCPVRKQVQRCPEDMSILITTYEGAHNHPLPSSATAMASTTSAAASMLLSGSSSSTSLPNSTTISADLHGLNFYLSDNSKSKQFYFHNSTLSSSPSCPTITLDLTSSSSSSHFNRLSTNYPPIPKFASTSLNFGSSDSNTMPWGNGLLSCGSTSSSTSQTHKNQIGALNLGRTHTDHNNLYNNLYQSYMQRNNTALHQQQSPPADTIAAAAKAITADPSFRSALAAALTSIIGNGSGSNTSGSGGGVNPGGVESFAQQLKWGDQLLPMSSSYSQTQQSNACATSYLSKATSTNSQPGNLMFLPPSLPFSSPRSASASAADNREHTN